MSHNCPTETPTPTDTQRPTHTPRPPTPTNTPTWYGCEPNEIFAEACLIFTGQTNAFHLWPTADEDWFVFDVVVPGLGGCVNVSLTSIPANRNYNLALYSPTNVLLATSANSSNANEFISYPMLGGGSGAYRVKVYAQGSNDYHSSDSYQLFINVTTTSCASLATIAP